jgi:hypothetical protein
MSVIETIAGRPVKLFATAKRFVVYTLAPSGRPCVMLTADTLDLAVEQGDQFGGHHTAFHVFDRKTQRTIDVREAKS